jgi:hypothetical protein
MNPIEGTLRRVDRYQQRHGWLGFPFAVVKNFGDDKGGNLTTLLAWNGFFALFPLLLILVTTLGFLLGRHPALEQQDGRGWSPTSSADGRATGSTPSPTSSESWTNGPGHDRRLPSGAGAPGPPLPARGNPRPGRDQLRGVVGGWPTGCCCACSTKPAPRQGSPYLTTTPGSGTASSRVSAPHALVRRRRSTRANRPATRPITSSNSSCQRAGSTSRLWPVATVLVFGCRHNTR